MKKLFRTQISRSLMSLILFMSSYLLAGLIVTTPSMSEENVNAFQPAQSLYAGEFVVPLNKSQILTIDKPFKELIVGNKDIADVMALTDRRIYALGKTVGSTNLVIYDSKREIIAVMDLVVSFDTEALKAKLFEVMPDEEIEVRTANGAILLTGMVSSAERVHQASVIAERFAPQAVTNNLKIPANQQVMLEVRFVEVSRDLSRKLGLSETFDAISGDITFSLVTSGLIGTAVDPSFGTASLSVSDGGWSLDSVLDLLERRGLVKTLAEPTLVAMSGDTASFLAGGEFPFPVVQGQGAGSNSITIEFKKFGVGLSFSPTVLDNEIINLDVIPEVSQLDATNAVEIEGVEIPALTTRRAETNVELRDGQSFAIAGLIQSNYENRVRQLPWLGDVPVLGALFRSSAFERDETELVIIVTPHIASPARSPDMLATPVDNLSLPSDFDLFLLGRTEGREGEALRRSGGRMSGSHGYILD